MQDHARALIVRGRRDAATIGAYMAGHALLPDRVVISPAARTQETWKIAATAFRPAPGAMTAAQLYDATPSTPCSPPSDTTSAALSHG